MSETIEPVKLKAALSTPTTSSSKKDKKESSSSNKEKKNESDSSRKRASSGGGKRSLEKRGSNLTSSVDTPKPIKVAPIPEEPTTDPGTPTFGGGEFWHVITRCVQIIFSVSHENYFPNRVEWKLYFLKIFSQNH